MYDTAGEPGDSVDKRASAHPFKHGAKACSRVRPDPRLSSSKTGWATPSCGRCVVGESPTRRGFAWRPMALYGQHRYRFGASTRWACRLSLRDARLPGARRASSERQASSFASIRYRGAVILDGATRLEVDCGQDARQHRQRRLPRTGFDPQWSTVASPHLRPTPVATSRCVIWPIRSRSPQAAWPVLATSKR
jgi:hypothetical protein